jgi:hypothetical protein
MEPYIILAWLFGLALACALYAWFLDSLDRRYEPRWTWTTVAGGNALIGMVQAGIIWSIYDLESAVRFSGLLITTNVVAGLPVVLWQEIQHRRRKRAAAIRRNGDLRNGTTYEGSTRAP